MSNFLNEMEPVIYEYTLEEVLNLVGLDTVNILLENEINYEFLIRLVIGAPSDYENVFKNYKLEPIKQLIPLLLKKYADYSFLTSYEELKRDMDFKRIKEVRNRFYLLFNFSNLACDRIVKEYELYRNVIENLKLKLSTSSVGKTKFNDTPQEANVGTENKFMSTYTEVSHTTESETQPVADALANAHKNLYNFIEEWISSFEKFFWR